MSEWQFNYLFTLKNANLSSNSYNFRMQPNIPMKFTGYMAWILLCKHCKFGKKIYYNSGDIEFFLGDYFFWRALYIEDRRPTTDRPTNDLAFWKISNGYISATGRLIDFVFDPRVGFSRSVDRMGEWCYFRLDQIQDGGWTPSREILYSHISGMDLIRSASSLVLG